MGSGVCDAACGVEEELLIRIITEDSKVVFPADDKPGINFSSNNVTVCFAIDGKSPNQQVKDTGQRSDRAKAIAPLST